MMAVEGLARDVGVVAACEAVQVPRSTFYRRRRPKPRPVAGVGRRRSHRGLTDDENRALLAIMTSERFVDVAPAEIHATLLDEGRCLGSVSTMYRLLRKHAGVRERRNQLRHPSYAAPELMATGPNQLWSWDITKLKGPEKWNYYHLYVILDVFSRYVVGWLVANAECSKLAKQLLAEAIGKQELDPTQLTVHADRGTSMKSKRVAHLLADLGVTKTHSRPYTSNDNPFSESQFKTLKYRPDFPDRFGSQSDALAFSRRFFPWYNQQHRHHGIAMLTPAQVHHGLANQILDARQRVLDRAFDERPERFKRRPVVRRLSDAVWINPPTIAPET